MNVAILDTGVDTSHPDLVGQVADSQSFAPGEDVTDRNGHSTHAASAIAGTASGSTKKGVTHGAHLLIGKVLSNAGSGDESWITAGMQWAAQTGHAKIIGMSLGISSPGDVTDPMAQPSTT